MDKQLRSVLSGRHNMEILLVILRNGKCKASDLRMLTSNIGDLSNKLKELEAAGLLVSSWEVMETGSSAQVYRLTEDKGIWIAEMYYASRCIMSGSFDIETSTMRESIIDEFDENGGRLWSLLQSEFDFNTGKKTRGRKTIKSESE